MLYVPCLCRKGTQGQLRLFDADFQVIRHTCTHQQARYVDSIAEGHDVWNATASCQGGHVGNAQASQQAGGTAGGYKGEPWQEQPTCSIITEAIGKGCRDLDVSTVGLREGIGWYYGILVPPVLPGWDF